jgi:hypothetical protein
MLLAALAGVVVLCSVAATCAYFDDELSDSDCEITVFAP